jgi:hypothetical protein
MEKVEETTQIECRKREFVGGRGDQVLVANLQRRGGTMHASG